jgi:hypothetical protein
MINFLKILLGRLFPEHAVPQPEQPKEIKKEPSKKRAPKKKPKAKKKKKK